MLRNDLSGLGMSAGNSAQLQGLPEHGFFMRSLSQQSRLLSVLTPLPEAVLLVEQMRGREAVSEDFCFEVQCLADSAHLELKSLIGEEVSLRVLLADGRSWRNWHGLITSASILGSDGGLARYALRLEPWTACLSLSRHCRIFQKKTVEEIAREILIAYPGASFEFRLSQPLPVLDLCTQYRETDRAFLDRLLASEGLSYYFEHDQLSGADDLSSQHSRHKLVVFDTATEATPCRQPLIRFHRNHATEASDSIQTLQQRACVGSNQFTRSSWDYRSLQAPSGRTDAEGLRPHVPELEDYVPLAASHDPDAETAARRSIFSAHHAALLAESLSLTGTARQLEAAAVFTLTQHSGVTAQDAQLRVLVVEHEASNNLDAASLPGGTPLHQQRIERGIYRNQALCVKASLPLVPAPKSKPVVPGMQTALVVAPSGASSDTGTFSERDGRVRIQFHWQRGRNPNSGGMQSETERAPGDHSNGIWVRVAESLAGPDWGSCFTPRVGSEVLVEFDAGDIDHPVVVAALYNGIDSPPWPAGEASAANHPGVLAGFHAPTLDGEGWGQWQIDDMSGQLRTRLASSAYASQLNLGYLIHHKPVAGQRGAWRGQGFELRTDGWQIQRAAKGMLISTSARQNATSTQLDTAEPATQLKAAADTAQRLSDAASQSEADSLAQAARIDAFQQCIHPEQAPADGTDQPDRELNSFEAPAMLIEAPASIAFASPASSTVFAGEHLSATVQGDAQLTAQHTLSLVAGEATGLYTHAGGIKAIAANAPLSIQAHDGELEILADQDVTVTSSNDEIHVLANSKIVLQAGQSSITLEGSNITFACPGKFEIKASQKALMGGGSGAASLGALPTGLVNIVPSGVDHPSLMPDVFSQALGFAEHPSQWLPFSSLGVQVFKDKSQIAGEFVARDDLYTQSYLTGAPTNLRYALVLQSAWVVEQSIDIAGDEVGGADSEEEFEQ